MTQNKKHVKQIKATRRKHINAYVKKKKTYHKIGVEYIVPITIEQKTTRMFWAEKPTLFNRQ